MNGANSSADWVKHLYSAPQHPWANRGAYTSNLCRVHIVPIQYTCSSMPLLNATIHQLIIISRGQSQDPRRYCPTENVFFVGGRVRGAGARINAPLVHSFVGA